MNGYSDILQVCVPSAVMQDGYHFMRSAGQAGLEGMVLWAGKRTEQTVLVSELIVPQQRALRTSDGLCAIVDGDELRRLNMHLYKNSLDLIAQVHTHPGRAYHSSTDDQYAIATTVGCFSIVVPNFAVIDYPLSECAVYRLDEHGSWRPVDESVSPNRIVVV